MRFLLAGHDAGGTIPPMLALAQEMVSRGHDVTWLSQPSVRERAEASGCRFVAFDQLPSYVPRTTIEDQFELAMRVIAGTESGDQLVAVAKDESSDVVVLDCNLAGAAAAIETLNRPSALLFHSMYITFTDVWFAEFWPFLAPAINDARRCYALAPAESWPDVFAGHDRLISVVPDEFDAPVVDVPETMRRFGFLVPAPQPAAAPPTTFPEGDDPTVLVSLSSTYQHQEDILQRILDALAGRSVRGLLTTAGQVDRSALSVPHNATVLDYIDHGLVLDNTDVVITHGGMGTVAAGLSRGLPMVCVPYGRDQHANARRVADVGAGIALDSDASPTQIGAALDQILTNAAYRLAAQGMASASAAAGGAPTAVADLEALSL